MLRHITRISYARAAHLAAVAVFAPSAGVVTISAFIPWRDLCAVGISSLSEDTKVEGGVRTVESTLTATLAARVKFPTQPLAFRLECADGTVWLFGTGRKPFPVVVQNDQRAARVSDTAAVTLTATRTASFGVLKVISEAE